MTLDQFDKLISSIQAIVTTASIIIAGVWAYNRFIRQQENFPNLVFSADINIIGRQDTEWLVELIAIVENRGKVQHKMENFTFVFDALYKDEKLNSSKDWRDQIDFPHAIARGTFLPDTMKYFFVDPGTSAKYSYITKLPAQATFAILHCNFTYIDKRNYTHTAERTIKVKDQNAF